ncbi:MAG: ATP-binding protein [Thermoplasmatota archaeon]
MVSEESYIVDDKIETRALFPFSAIVGHDMLKRGLILNLINKDIGGVLIKGDKGTGKSLTVNSFENILPTIEVVKGCNFNCSPIEPEKFCLECKEKHEEGTIQTVEKKMEVIHLPLNITEDRLIGTIDVEKVLQEGVKSFEPGLLARANRNILYIDQINLLDHSIVDLLLDVAAMKSVTVEREGISTDYLSDFTMIASMNPEEGFLRPQLLDRFSLQIETETISEPRSRVDLIKRNREYVEDKLGMISKYEDDEKRLINRIKGAQKRLPRVTISDELLSLVCTVCREFDVDGHRGDIIIMRVAVTNAAYEGREEVSLEDVLLASEMALPHRMRSKPFQKEKFSREKLEDVVDEYWDR